LDELPLSAVEHSEIRLASNYDIEDLKESFKAQGQLSPIKVRPNRRKNGSYEVVFGNRRLRAAAALGWKTIKAEVVEANDWEKVSMALSENLDRKNFSDYEIALLVDRLHALSGKTYGEIAALINRSNAFVSQHISMLDLFPDGSAPENEKAVVLNSITERHARILAKIEDLSERWSTAKLAVSANLGLRELQRVASHHFERKIRQTSWDSRKTLTKLVSDVIVGVSSNDLRPLFDSRSTHGYSLFSQFPPFLKLNREMAQDHLCSILRESRGLRVRLQDLDLRIHGNFAYATMYVIHEITYNGKTLKNKTRTTMIFAKEDNLWKIVHEHFSPVESREMRMFFDHIEHVNHIFTIGVPNSRTLSK
jgi:ParB/RepB/Spo0J family partition protein